MAFGNSQTVAKMVRRIFVFSALAASTSATSETYRFPSTFLIELGTAVAETEANDVGGVTYRWSNIDVASRLPTELAFVFESEQDLLFPEVITGVFAVKPKDSGFKSVLMAPMTHQGGGEYRFFGSTGHDVAAWFETHGKELVAGNVVLERIDGLFDTMAKMNPGTSVVVTSRFMFAGNEIGARGHTQTPRFATGRHRELGDALQEGRALPEWYLEQLAPQERALATEMANKRAARLAEATRGDE